MQVEPVGLGVGPGCTGTRARRSKPGSTLTDGPEVRTAYCQSVHGFIRYVKR